ncbi:MAG: hypothetical protein IPN95_19555 [Bacteroidetes bacterium]|nr:hypothetical protein [Bacteroidota bacterium]
MLTFTPQAPGIYYGCPINAAFPDPTMTLTIAPAPMARPESIILWRRHLSLCDWSHLPPGFNVSFDSVAMFGCTATYFSQL